MCILKTADLHQNIRLISFYAEHFPDCSILVPKYPESGSMKNALLHSFVMLLNPQL